MIQVGKYDGIVLSASDGSRRRRRRSPITVTPVNEPPQFVPLLPQSGREDTPLQFTVSADDPNGDPLTFAVSSGLPTGASFDTQDGPAPVDTGIRAGW